MQKNWKVSTIVIKRPDAREKATYAVFRTQRFEKELAKQFSPDEQKQVETFEKKRLKENPYVGDPLKYPFFREKKADGKRVYLFTGLIPRRLRRLGFSFSHLRRHKGSPDGWYQR